MRIDKYYRIRTYQYRVSFGNLASLLLRFAAIPLGDARVLALDSPYGLCNPIASHW